MRALEPLRQTRLEGVLRIDGVELAELGVEEGVKLALLQVLPRDASPERPLQPDDLGNVLPAVVLPEAGLKRLEAALLLVCGLLLGWRRLMPGDHGEIVSI